MKTRARIVEEAKRLFNEAGYAQATTQALARRLGMSEGNLWYHFKTKAALLDAVRAEYADAIERRLELRPAPGGDVVADYARLLALFLAELRDYRCLYRDQADYGEHSAAFLKKLPGWYGRTQDQLRAYFAAMADAGALDWPEERLADLVINATIILRYSLEYAREIGGDTGEGGGSARRAVRQHLTLFEHKLAPQAARRLRKALDRIETAPLAAAG